MMKAFNLNITMSNDNDGERHEAVLWASKSALNDKDDGTMTMVILESVEHYDEQNGDDDNERR